MSPARTPPPRVPGSTTGPYVRRMTPATSGVLLGSGTSGCTMCRPVCCHRAPSFGALGRPTFTAPGALLSQTSSPAPRRFKGGEPQQRANLFAPCPLPGFVWGSPALRGMQLSRPTTTCMWLASPRRVGRPVGVGLAAPSLFTSQVAVPRGPCAPGNGAGPGCSCVRCSGARTRYPACFRAARHHRLAVVRCGVLRRPRPGQERQQAGDAKIR